MKRVRTRLTQKNRFVLIVRKIQQKKNFLSFSFYAVFLAIVLLLHHVMQQRLSR